MPDQSSASSEHALIQEITAPLATLPADSVPQVTEVDFPVVLRGYDRIAVDAYVRKTGQLVAELQATRSPEAAVRRALERVGEEVSGILQRAHETAEQVTATSRREAEDRLEAARLEAADMTAAAERRVKELDAETDRIWAERHRIVEDTRELARQLVGLAESASERFPAEDAAPEGPAAGQDTEATTAFGAPPALRDEDETHVAFRAPGEDDEQQLDWGAAQEWHGEPPANIAGPPEYELGGDDTQPTTVHRPLPAPGPESESESDPSASEPAGPDAR